MKPYIARKVFATTSPPFTSRLMTTGAKSRLVSYKNLNIELGRENLAIQKILKNCSGKFDVAHDLQLSNRVLEAA